MSGHFIPVASRPSPNRILAQEAWALAASLDVRAHTAARPRVDEASQGVLLVMASAGDATAQRFVSAMQQQGIVCICPRSAQEMNIRLLARQDGSYTCDLSFGLERVPVRAVLNRGLSFPAEQEQADSFVEAELLASWWAILACFPGPVINRPSRMGFLPDLDIMRLSSICAGVKLPAIQIATSRFVAFVPPATHLRRLSDGGHAGSFPAAPEKDLDNAEVYTATTFDPLRTRQILLAGRKLFDLGHPNGDISLDLAQQLRPLTEQLCLEQTNFCMFVVQDDSNGLRIVHASPFPSVHQYQHFEERVNQSLLEFLQS